jgi:hypothetical protein
MGYLVSLFLITISLLGLYIVILSLLCEKKFYTFLFIWLCFPYLAFKVHQYHRYTLAIPLGIEITWPIRMGEQLIDGYGTVVFQLSDSTLKQIEAKGIRFFDSTIQARGHTGQYYSYKSWKETPFPSKFRTEDTSFMSHFMSEQLLQEIIATLKQKGSFYCIANHKQIIIIPSLRYII